MYRIRDKIRASVSVLCWVLIMLTMLHGSAGWSGGRRQAAGCRPLFADAPSGGESVAGPGRT